jgi:hypothetical protein
MDASGDDFVERFRESEQRLQDILDNAPAVSNPLGLLTFPSIPAKR